MHESSVLKIVPIEIQPRDDIICRGCIHGIWRLSRSRTDNEQSVSCKCKVLFETSYSILDTPIETLSCDSFCDTPPEKDD